MRLALTDPPREFDAAGVRIKDFGKIHLAADEMISMVSASGKECDFAAKAWGFYLAPSINSRLRQQGFKVALVRNQQGKFFLNAVEEDKLDLFQQYLKTNQDSEVICWLDEWEEK
jgi:hypothetical protein